MIDPHGLKQMIYFRKEGGIMGYWSIRCLRRKRKQREELTYQFTQIMCLSRDRWGCIVGCGGLALIAWDQRLVVFFYVVARESEAERHDLLSFSSTKGLDELFAKQGGTTLEGAHEVLT